METASDTLEAQERKLYEAFNVQVAQYQQAHSSGDQAAEAKAFDALVAFLISFEVGLKKLRPAAGTSSTSLRNLLESRGLRDDAGEIASAVFDLAISRLAGVPAISVVEEHQKVTGVIDQFHGEVASTAPQATD
ncbi:MAG: hypothetical protein PHI23_00815 [Candidatus Peribacteraceae bacterium]|nr:hypothetical protein [Candidatus Peribacteraceae bacterium]